MPASSFSQWRPHPWHGLPAGKGLPYQANAYIEITPFDTIKYEVDKASGYVKVDRPQRTSSQPPALYGFIPRTYCGAQIASLCPGAARGDGDPLDICVFSERPVTRAEILIPARIVGGLQLVDGGEADDKIIAILDGDLMWGEINDVTELPRILIERLEHYFLTYKIVKGVNEARISVQAIYGREHAGKVVTAALADYDALITQGESK